jgi:hypothetical protein
MGYREDTLRQIKPSLNSTYFLSFVVFIHEIFGVKFMGQNLYTYILLFSVNKVVHVKKINIFPILLI